MLDVQYSGKTVTVNVQSATVSSKPDVSDGSVDPLEVVPSQQNGTKTVGVGTSSPADSLDEEIIAQIEAAEQQNIPEQQPPINQQKTVAKNTDTITEEVRVEDFVIELGRNIQTRFLFIFPFHN